MVSLRVKQRRIVVFIVLTLITVVGLVGFFSSGGDDKPDKPTRTTTTTTTLPEKNAQACEFLTPAALLAGGIIPDVDAKTSDDKKRCTYEDIGGEVNYVTLYVDAAEQCEILLSSTKKKSALPEVSAQAVYSDETDPTIIVTQGTRCFFVQGAKTLVTKTTLTAMAKAITDLFVAVDASTTTTTQTTVVLPEAVTTLPGVNTAPSTTSTTTTTTIKPTN